MHRCIIPSHTCGTRFRKRTSALKLLTWLMNLESYQYKVNGARQVNQRIFINFFLSIQVRKAEKFSPQSVILISRMRISPRTLLQSSKLKVCEANCIGCEHFESALLVSLVMNFTFHKNLALKSTTLWCKLADHSGWKMPVIDRCTRWAAKKVFEPPRETKTFTSSSDVVLIYLQDIISGASIYDRTTHQLKPIWGLRVARPGTSKARMR